MPNLSVQIGADTSKLVQGINNAKQSLDKFITDMHNAAAAGEEMKDVSEEQVQAYNKVIQGLEKAADGTKTAKQEQKALSKQLQELKDLWASLSNEARSSDFGKSMAETMSAAKEELAALKTQMASMGEMKMPETGGSLKRELRAASNELIGLTAQYRAMSAAEKQSAGGQELAKKMDELRAKAGELKDTIGDVNTEITAMASDTPNLSAFGEILGVTGDLLSAHASIIAKVTGDEKALKDAIATVMAVQTTYNAVLKIANPQETFACSLAKIRKIQEGAAAVAIRIKTAAEGKSIITTKAATIAQAAFNTVAAMNPYVLLATAIIGLVAGIATFIIATKKSTEAEEANAKATKKQAEAYNEALKDSLEETIPRYMRLQAEWKNLRSEGEKKQWLKENKEEFHKLGIEVNKVGDAENVLVTNTQAAMNAFMQRAKAAAIAAKAAEIYRQSLEDIQWFEEQRGSKSVTADELASHGSSVGEAGAKFDHHGGFFHTGRARYSVNTEKAIRERKAKAEAAMKELFTALAKEQEKGNEMLKNAGIQTYTGGSNKKGKKKPNKNSLKEAEETLQQWQDALDNADFSNVELVKAINKKIKEAEEEVKKRKIALGMKVELEIDPNSLQAMEDELSKLKSDYRKGWRPDLNNKTFNEEVKNMERKIRNKKIELGLVTEFTSEMQKELEKEINEKVYKLNNLQLSESAKKNLSLKAQEKILDEAKKMMQAEIDQLSGYLSTVSDELYARDKLTIQPAIDFKKLNELLDQVDKDMNDAVRKKYNFLEFPPDPTAGLGLWKKKAERELRRVKFLAPEIPLKTDDKSRRDAGFQTSLSDDLEYHQTIVDSLQSSYDEIMEKIRKVTGYTAEEFDQYREYVTVEENLKSLKERYFDILRQKERGLVTTEQVTEAENDYIEACGALSDVEAKYSAVVKKVRELTGLTNAEAETMSIYEGSEAAVNQLTEAYKKATDAAYEFNRKSMLSERRWDVFRSGVSSIGNLSNALDSNAEAWARINGKELNKEFKNTMAVIDATVNSIKMLVDTYDAINNMIKLFGEISEITAAKKVAADSAIIASGEAKSTAETANTATTVANTQTETQAKMASIGVDQAKSLSSATASGASLPFPANIAAIAAGIAAVVAAFAMVFSSFAEGGIVGGGSYIGDKQIVRVNAGEMILNGQQQKRLFNLLNGTGSRNGNTVGQGGEVVFHIKGNDLYGVLTNRNKKVSKI